jgi:hypothetical protein
MTMPWHYIRPQRHATASAAEMLRLLRKVASPLTFANKHDSE